MSRPDHGRAYLQSYVFIKHAGFSLVELLVALFVFSLLSVFAFGALNTLTSSREMVGEEQKALSGLQKSILLLERDIRRAIYRLGDVDVSGGLFTGTAADGIDMIVLDSEGFGNRSSVARRNVRYLLKDNVLYRTYVESDGIGSLGGQPLLQDVTAFDLAYQASQDSALMTVILKVEHARFGHIQRVWVRDVASVTEFNTLAEDNNGGGDELGDLAAIRREAKSLVAAALSVAEAARRDVDTAMQMALDAQVLAAINAANEAAQAAQNAVDAASLARSEADLLSRVEDMLTAQQILERIRIAVNEAASSAEVASEAAGSVVDLVEEGEAAADEAGDGSSNQEQGQGQDANQGDNSEDEEVLDETGMDEEGVDY